MINEEEDFRESGGRFDVYDRGYIEGHRYHADAH